MATITAAAEIAVVNVVFFMAGRAIADQIHLHIARVFMKETDLLLIVAFKALTGMTQIATPSGPAKRAPMNVITLVAVITPGGSADLPARYTRMTFAAGQPFMRAVQHEIRLRVVIELPQTPGIGIVAPGTIVA